MKTTGCSLWLLLPSPIRLQLGKVIEDLSASYDSPKFDPHITLVGSLIESKEKIIGAASALFADLPPLPIQLAGFGYAEPWSRCLYIEVVKTPDLMQAYERTSRYLPYGRNAPYHPHISLLYGTYSLEVKTRILATLAQWAGTTFTVDTAAVVSTDGAPQSWHYLGSHSLRGHGFGPDLPT